MAVQWLARMFGLSGGKDDDIADDIASFEHVDGSLLAADEFHQSDSMRLDGAIRRDFTETLPAYSHRGTPPARPVRHWA